MIHTIGLTKADSDNKTYLNACIYLSQLESPKLGFLILGKFMMVTTWTKITSDYK